MWNSTNLDNPLSSVAGKDFEFVEDLSGFGREQLLICEIIVIYYAWSFAGFRVDGTLQIKYHNRHILHHALDSIHTSTFIHSLSFIGIDSYSESESKHTPHNLYIWHLASCRRSVIPQKQPLGLTSLLNFLPDWIFFDFNPLVGLSNSQKRCKKI